MIYIYQCRSCEKQREHICPAAERPDSLTCNCGGTMTRRPQIPALHFVGPGWVCNDFDKMSERKTKQLQKMGVE